MTKQGEAGETMEPGGAGGLRPWQRGGSHGGAAGSTGRGGVRDSEAGEGDAPGQTLDEVLALGRSTALSLLLTMARQFALHLRWALSVAPSSGLMVGWALGVEWDWQDLLPFLTSTDSSKAAKLSRGPSSDNGALQAVLRLAL